MGLFDYINVQMKCPSCGAEIPSGTFQSKDDTCSMDLLDPDFVNSFYTICDNCREWIEFNKSKKVERGFRKTPFSRKEVEELGFKLVSPKN